MFCLSLFSNLYVPLRTLRTDVWGPLVAKRKCLDWLSRAVMADAASSPENARLIEKQQQCPVCLDDGPTGVTRCGHAFHEECLMRCIEEVSPLCPMCRADLFADDSS